MHEAERLHLDRLAHPAIASGVAEAQPHHALRGDGQPKRTERGQQPRCRVVGRLDVDAAGAAAVSFGRAAGSAARSLRSADTASVTQAEGDRGFRERDEEQRVRLLTR